MFDYVLCTEVLEHVPEPIKAYLEYVKRRTYYNKKTILNKIIKVNSN